MSNVDINKEAYKQAEKELFDAKVKEVKNYILQTLQKIEQKKHDKERLEEELRILKLDLDDLKSGKFKKIEERLEKSKVARGVTVVPDTFFDGLAEETMLNSPNANYNNVDWASSTSGTYTVSTNGTSRNFYL